MQNDLYFIFRPRYRMTRLSCSNWESREYQITTAKLYIEFRENENKFLGSFFLNSFRFLSDISSIYIFCVFISVKITHELKIYVLK